MIDTHCHLEMREFDPDRSDVIHRALDEAGMPALITISSDPASMEPAMRLAESDPRIYFTAGLHPHDARLMTTELMARIESAAGHPKAVGIGETGLDYHYDHSPRDVQRKVFAEQLALAHRLGLPAIVHIREAVDDGMAIMREAGLARGVLHCFSGDARLMEFAIERCLHMSIAGPVTFPKAVELKEAATRIPDDLLLVETDAPYLTPVPYRGKRNEPAYVAYTAAEVARLRGVTIEDIARITTLNAHRLFCIGRAPQADTVAYQIRNSLYLNITNRCTNRCSFCIRSTSDFVKGHNLRLSHEPTTDEVRAAIGDPSKYDEIVFCGYGEPLIRLDLVTKIARWVKERGGRVRINTNGQAALIHGRDVLPDLAGLVDVYSVSLDAQDAETYNRICLPAKAGAYEAVREFIRAASKSAPEVIATVVTAPGVDVEACRNIAQSLGAKLRVRELDIVG